MPQPGVPDDHRTRWVNADDFVWMDSLGVVKHGCGRVWLEVRSGDESRGAVAAAKVGEEEQRVAAEEVL